MNKPKSVIACLGLVTALLLLSVAAPTNVATAHCAGKHNGNHPHCSVGEDPPSEDDPCLTSTSPFPAFTFLEGTGSNGGGPYKLMASSTDGICQRVLLDETQGAGNTDFVFIDGDSKGRVLWDNGGSKVFVLEFTVAGNEVIWVGTPVQVLDTIVEANSSYWSGWGWGYGMSRDGQKLAYSWTPDNTTQTHSLHIVDLDSCIASSCVHDPATAPVVLSETASALGGDHVQWREVGWDTAGEKIILIQNLQFDDGTRHVLSVRFVYVDFGLENPYVSDTTPLNKFTLNDPDFGPYGAVSGWSEIPGQSAPGIREKLAVQTHVGEGAECAEIAIFDVDDCVSGTGNMCGQEARFVGTNPTW